MAGFLGLLKLMRVFTRLNSPHFSLVTPITTCGNLSSTFKLKTNSIPFSSAPPTPSMTRLTGFPRTSPRRVSHRPHGPPSHPPERFGHTSDPGYQLVPRRLTQRLLLTHTTTNHNRAEPPPHTRGTTKSNSVLSAVCPLLSKPLQKDKTRRPNAHGKPEELTKTLKQSPHPFTSPPQRNLTRWRSTQTHHMTSPLMPREHATRNYNFTLASYNPPKATTSSTSPPLTFNSKTGIT